ncbi:PREDICTED: uncharacterized protein LOC106819124 [Priapulus caudatus]|uniref:Uncharacterized protein LOC106819124 n=1 Tax=Priapulus caudatus TaxID=37621 RepID=A0ABM1F4A2_PRICU|nr:PREDICTED: uncharacterized protein LOC106819124 [Priapulus caudatus]
MSDLACLMSGGPNAVSGDVPASLDRLAAAIRSSAHARRFLDLNSTDAVKLLDSEQSGEIKSVYDDFLNKHGHRCVGELELREKPWRSNPEQLMSTLQAMVRQDASAQRKKKPAMSVDDALNTITSPLTPITRRILKWLVPIGQINVSQREATKNCVVLQMDKMRQGYTRLAQLMVSQTRIPDADLIFFFTHDELGELLRTRSAKLVRKAQRRRKMFPALRAIKFPEFQLRLFQRQSKTSQKKRRTIMYRTGCKEP